MLKNETPPTGLIIINGLTFVASGYIFIGVSLSNLSHLSYSKS